MSKFYATLLFNGVAFLYLRYQYTHVYNKCFIKNNFNFLEYIARYNANNFRLLLQNHAFDKTFWQD